MLRNDREVDFSERRVGGARNDRRISGVGEGLPNDVYCKRLLAETSGRTNIMRKRERERE